MAGYVAAVKKFASGEEGRARRILSAGRPGRRRKHLDPLWTGPEHQEYVRPGQHCGRDRERRDHLRRVAVTSDDRLFPVHKRCRRQPASSSSGARVVEGRTLEPHPSSGGRRDRPAIRRLPL